MLQSFNVCQAERSEESTSIAESMAGYEGPAGFFAALLMNLRSGILNAVKNPPFRPPFDPWILRSAQNDNSTSRYTG
jgi:hypothetical protein